MKIIFETDLGRSRQIARGLLHFTSPKKRIFSSRTAIKAPHLVMIAISVIVIITINVVRAMIDVREAVVVTMFIVVTTTAGVKTWVLMTIINTGKTTVVVKTVVVTKMIDATGMIITAAMMNAVMTIAVMTIPAGDCRI